MRIGALDTLTGKRLVNRQSAAGSHTLFKQLLENAGLQLEELVFPITARTESDATLAVLDGKADAAFGLLGMAMQFRLDFVPLVRERFDLLVDRRGWFEPPIQRLLHFCGQDAFADKAANLGGYDVAGFGTILFNGAT